MGIKDKVERLEPLANLSKDQLRTLVRFVENPKALLASIIVGWLGYDKAKERVADDGFLMVIFRDFLFRTILKPAGTLLIDAGLAILDSLLFILYGGDYEIGIGPKEGAPGVPSTPGLLDIPLLFSGVIADAYLAFTGAISASIGQINQNLVDAVAPLGIAAPIVTTVAWAFEIGIVLYGSYYALSVIDIPFVDLGQALERISTASNRLLDLIT